MWWVLSVGYGGLVVTGIAVATRCCIEIRRLRRLGTEFERLNDLLQSAVIWAFLHQHLPIWLAWERYSGMHFRIKVVGPSGPPEREGRGAGQDQGDFDQ